MIYLISDLHGYPHNRFLELLDKAKFGKDDFLYILGDVIDRNGDGGIETLKWLLLQTNAQLILGNHEAMLLGVSFVFDEITEDSINKIDATSIEMLMNYQKDGGDVTLKAMHKLSKNDRMDILDYLRDAPLYETIEVNGRGYILVHSGLDNFDSHKRIEDYSSEDLLWAWPDLSDVYYTKVKTIFGHTPTFSFDKKFENKIIDTPTWCAIDMGAGFGHEPVLLRLNDMKEFRNDAL